MKTQRSVTFSAMGSATKLVLHGPAKLVTDAASRGRTRIDELESKWSRFLPGSEVSQANANADQFVEVSSDTIRLFKEAAAAYRTTGGAFNPMMLGAIRGAGYDRTFAEIDFPDSLGEIMAQDLQLPDIDVGQSTVRVRKGSGFDPGGIGKGLAADIVAEELAATGLEGVLVSLGGDLRCLGRPEAGAWLVRIMAAPEETASLVALDQGAIATSTRLKRRWEQLDACEGHHLLDPTTQRSSESTIRSVSVITNRCVDAEWIATATAANANNRPDTANVEGAAIQIVESDGSRSHFGDFESYLR